MTSYKESHAGRTSSHHRPTSSTTPMNVPGRHSGSRNHAHSISLGSLNPTHRVTRRKSMTNTAITAVIQGMNGASLEAMVSPDDRGRGGNGIRRAESSSTVKPETPTNRPYALQGYRGPQDAEGESAIVDGQPLAESVHGAAKIRNRRASDGAYLSKTDAKRASRELKCEKCGKGYKHSSCLTKHLWEHTPEWSLTSKLLISKHQQVQLLEAASVLVQMNQDPATADAAKAVDSDNSSASPPASGSSEIQDDDLSSVETTPPPFNDHTSDFRDSKRYSSTSSVFSRSSQSIPGGSIAPSSVPTSSYGSYHQQGYIRRLSTPGSGFAGAEDEAGLAAAAAAINLMDFGTPHTHPTAMAEDIPPVPLIPERYVSHNASRSIGGAVPIYSPTFTPAPPLVHRISDERDVKMHEAGPHRPTNSAGKEHEYYDQRTASRGRVDDYDDGVFGHMEE